MPGRLGLTPRRYHLKHHSTYVLFDECRRCQRSRAICKSKIQYWSVNDADEATKRINENEGYASPVVRYWCRWCLHWHVTTARNPRRRARAEKQRRKWLVRQHNERRAE